MATFHIHIFWMQTHPPTIIFNKSDFTSQLDCSVKYFIYVKASVTENNLYQYLLSLWTDWERITRIFRKFLLWAHTKTQIYQVLLLSHFLWGNLMRSQRSWTAGFLLVSVTLRCWKFPLFAKFPPVTMQHSYFWLCNRSAGCIFDK